VLPAQRTPFEHSALQHARHSQSALLAWSRSLLTRILLLTLAHASFGLASFASCIAPQNPIEAENCLPGTPTSAWYLDNAGSPNIVGFTTDISVNAGQTVYFKVMTNALAYRIEIYRLGYYQGNGARLVATVLPSVVLPQTQPPCLTDSLTGLTDCGNWAISASWAVPGTATSGIYFVRLIRLDTGEVGVAAFVVRNDASRSALLFQTSDPTWQAYNDYGGQNLYGCGGAYNNNCRAFKVSYNRPFHTGTFNPYTWLFSEEYPMVRWLEANGYDVSYIAGVDTDRNGTQITQHKVFMSVGHDEYWSAGQRSNVEAARTAGVNLAFFSGNEIFWKTRWEASIDGTNTPYRTLVCYKETLNAKAIDPADPPTWTGTWRDTRFSPPADGGRPENGLTGTLFMVNTFRRDAITVPQADGRMRVWRNTSLAALAPGQIATLPTGTLGYEWDETPDNGFQPAGLVRLSTTTLSVSTYCTDPFGQSCNGNGVATHHLVLYRTSNGVLVFGAGTVQWSWGLDANHYGSGAAADSDMQQATVNLFADMEVQPATLQSGLVPATASTDAIPPTSTITSPASGTPVVAGSTLTLSGTATDSGGGVVGGVEVSVDGGKTWHPAVGRESWSFTFTPANNGTLTVQSRAVDDSGNLETPGPGITLTVTGASSGCPCTIWPSTAIPSVPDVGPDSPVELGVSFRADLSGYITGIRFYKSAANTGTHVGHLWSNSGTLLAGATFVGETASGWQQVNFSNPVAITANTVYVASYHVNAGHWSSNWRYFAGFGVDNPPLHAPADGAGGVPNGRYAYGSSSAFPANTNQSANYWVDVVFNGNVGPTPLSVSTTSLPNGTQSQPYNQSLAAAGGTAPFSWSVKSGLLPAGLTVSAAGQISGTPTTVGASNFTVQVTDSSIPVQTATQGLSITIVASSGCPCTIWPSTAIPAVPDVGPDSPVELGVSFRADLSGYITGIRFYKSAANTGTHVGHLWSNSGTLLASATFVGETASGWQQVNFSNPVAITANTVYVASYHVNAGHWSSNWSYFAGFGVDNPPLHAPADGAGGVPNGRYGYGSSSTFPANTHQSTNYWVDVVFNTSPH
jgi:hypothetical protein